MFRLKTPLFVLALAMGLFLVPAQDVAVAQNPTWAVTTGVTGAPTWTRENPGAASGTHMYVFGGRTGNSGGVNTNALWEFDGATWTQRTANGAVGSPPHRDRAAVCWDFSRNKLIVFGGRDIANVPLSDTWEWDPVTNIWTEIVTAGPSAREFVAMAYDPTSTSIVLFGGLDSTGTHLNDTWVLIGGTTWTNIPTTVTPSVRRQHSMVTRGDFGDVLMCCGQDASIAAPAKWRTDVHIWDGVNFDWILIPTVNTPAAVVANQAVYDEFRQQVVVTGGNGINGGSPTSEISEFDCNTNEWTTYAQATPGTPAPVIGRVSRYFMAFLPTTGYIYKINGQVMSGASVSTTIQYGFGAPANFPGNGSDCAMTVGVNGSPDDTDIHSVMGGDTVSIAYDSPGGTLNNTPMLSIVQVYATGSTPLPEAVLGVYYNATLPTFVLFDGLSTAGGLLSPVLGGYQFVGAIPPSLTGTGTSFMVNLLVTDSNYMFNVGFADAHEFNIQ